MRSFTHDAAGNVTYDNRAGQGYGYTYDAANRMESFSINGVVQAEYTYNYLGQQAIRTLTQTGQVINSIYGPAGNRIAEFDFDPVANTSTLIREYVWFEGKPIAVIEGGVVYFVRSDYIGKPVFATDATGTKVWEATYLPFGGVHTSSGTNINLRFPGQWFQSESGLHQNWMRDYDPTTGRYIQADPLGLVDGPSVYGYAKQNPGRYIDPTGEAVAAACLVPGISGVCAKVAVMCVEGAVIITGMILQSRAADTECTSCSTAPPPPPRDQCITQCTALALPTSDYGVSFFRCMNACTSNGNSGFPEWDKHFP